MTDGERSLSCSLHEWRFRLFLPYNGKESKGLVFYQRYRTAWTHFGSLLEPFQQWEYHWIKKPFWLLLALLTDLSSADNSCVCKHAWSNDVLNNSCVNQKMGSDGFVITVPVKDAVSSNLTRVDKLNNITKSTISKYCTECSQKRFQQMKST